MKKYLLLLLITFFYLHSFTQEHWESIVSGTDTWKYLAATSAPPTNWNQSTFDDSSWSSGTGGFGFGDEDDNTVVSSCNSLYLRKEFTISDISILQYLMLDIDYDDAFVLYLNGKEVARSSNITANPPLYNSALTVDHEALLYQGLDPERFFLNLNDLHTGGNLVAVQILNKNLKSTDLSSLIYLQSYVNSPTTIYSSVPSWFDPPFESSLPIVMINTEGQTIVDEPKITANMKIVNNASGVNCFTDTTYEYNGYIGIELRGSTSQWLFPKKSYTLETRTDSATNLNVSLMGLPAENDWILYAPYTDKSMIRNVLAYNMGNMTGRWSPRTKYCELFVNNEYRGVYVLVEKIKIDKNRLDLADLKSTDTFGDELTGGYIVKIDRPDSGYWLSPYKARLDIQDVPISYVDPKVDELATEQKEYIKAHVTAFEDAVRSINYTDATAGYRPYVNITSFVDYYIINEISRNLDANRVSTFFYKDKDSKGGKITMGPFWDYNIALGNANFFSAGNTDGWVVDGVGEGDTYGITFWWDKFVLDPYFNSNLRNRWDELRADKFSDAHLMSIIDSCATLLSEAQVRNFQKFNILNTYVWPNNYVGGTYTNEVNYLKTWVLDRLSWMDAQISILNAVEVVKDNAGICEVYTYPNPFSTYFKINLNLQSAADVKIQITDLLGKTIYETSKFYSSGISELEINYNELNTNTNLFIYNIYIDDKLTSSGKIMHK